MFIVSFHLYQFSKFLKHRSLSKFINYTKRSRKIFSNYNKFTSNKHNFINLRYVNHILCIRVKKGLRFSVTLNTLVHIKQFTFSEKFISIWFKRKKF